MIRMLLFIYLLFIIIVFLNKLIRLLLLNNVERTYVLDTNKYMYFSYFVEQQHRPPLFISQTHYKRVAPKLKSAVGE